MNIRYEIEIISPVHIGTGNSFSKFEGAWRRGKWHVIDLDKVLERGVDPHQLAARMGERNFDWGDYLKSQRIEPEDVASYSVTCKDAKARDVKEFIKTPFNKPYIPGSTIKGAIRTSILWKLIKDDPGSARSMIAELPTRGNRKSEWAAQNIERRVLGKDPNHDLLRSLQVSDTDPFDPDALEVVAAWTYTLKGSRLEKKIDRGREYKFYVESLMPESVAEFEIKTDDFLFEKGVMSKLRFSDRQRDAVLKLAETCNERAKAIVKSELDFFSRYEVRIDRGNSEILDLYEYLQEGIEKRHLKDGAFLLCIGWGTGWRAKTIGDLAHEMLGDQAFTDLRRRYRLGRYPENRNLPFPKTRKSDPVAQDTFGWVEVRPVK